MNFQPNKFQGKCDRCGKTVAAGAGSFRFLPHREVPASWHHTPGTKLRDFGMLEHHECRENFDGTDIHARFNPAS